MHTLQWYEIHALRIQISPGFDTASQIRKLLLSINNVKPDGKLLRMVADYIATPVIFHLCLEKVFVLRPGGKIELFRYPRMVKRPFTGSNSQPISKLLDFCCC